jgi:hypothetical protein
MNYGFNINGILGMDFLKRSRATLDIDENLFPIWTVKQCLVSTTD